jgi:hypothetical protein
MPFSMGAATADPPARAGQCVITALKSLIVRRAHDGLQRKELGKVRTAPPANLKLKVPPPKPTKVPAVCGAAYVEVTRGPRRGDRYSSFNPWMMASRSMACPASRKTYRPFRCTCRQATGDVEVASASAFSLSLASHLASNRERIAEL